MFATEIIQNEKEEDSMKIIDMFHGNVFIYDPLNGKVLFVKRVQDEDF